MGRTAIIKYGMTTIKDIVDSGGCSLPWLHVEVSLQQDKIWPCCKYKDPVGKASDNLLSVWNNDKFNKLRDDHKNQQEHYACKACMVAKDAFSYKKFKNDQYKNILDIEISKTELPRIFHFTLKNTCNLACRMCFPGNSSKFYQLTKNNDYIKSFYDYDNIDNKFDVTKLSGSFGNLTHLVITGGEPLIDEDCITLIDMVSAEAKHLKHIAFSTNMTIFNENLIKKLEQVDATITFNVSVDGPRKIHEYIRIGCNFNDLKDNLIRLSRNSKFKFSINSTISALNVGYLVDLIHELEDLQRDCVINFLRIMTSPVLQKTLHAGSLPKEIKNLYLNKLTEVKSSIYLANDFIKTGRLLLLEDIQSTDILRQYLAEFDIVAKTNRYEVYPEFQNIL